MILPITFVWMLWFQKGARARTLWSLAGGFVAFVILTATVVPVYVARHAPSLESLLELQRWRPFYRSLTAMTGTAWFALGLAGLLAGALSRERRREAATLALAYFAVAISVLLVRWLDIRYFLILGPITVLIAFSGVVTLADLAGRWRSIATAGLLAMLVVLAAYSARSTVIPVVSGFDRVAIFLRDHGPHDSVLYRGRYDGVFGFYLRAFDPRLERRMVLWRKLFATVEDREAFEPHDVVRVVQTRSGSRWFGVEVLDGPIGDVKDLLGRTLAGPEFELAHSFQVKAAGVSRVDLYRFKLALDPPPPLDLAFGGFSSRVFRGVEPIPSRP